MHTTLYSYEKYLIAGSAYSNSAYMVPAYKKFFGKNPLMAGRNNSMTFHYLNVLQQGIQSEFQAVRFPFLREFFKIEIKASC